MSSDAAEQSKQPKRQSGAPKAGASNNPANAANSSAAQTAAANTASASTSSTPFLPRNGGPSQDTSNQAAGSGPDSKQRKKRRGGKKHKRDRRQSFTTSEELPGMDSNGPHRPSLADVPEQRSHEARDSFYRLGRGANGSNTSLESEALLDHREHGPLQTRRQSIAQGMLSGRGGPTQSPRGSTSNIRQARLQPGQGRSRLSRVARANDSGSDEDQDETRPLMASSLKHRYGSSFANSPREERRNPYDFRRPSSSRSSRKVSRYRDQSADQDDYDVNNPPSMPGSPKFGAEMGLDDVMLTGAELDRGRSPELPREVLIDIDDNTPIDRVAGATNEIGSSGEFRKRKQSVAAEDDVCFPHDDVTEIGEEDARSEINRRRHRRRREWPELYILENWANEEKELRTRENIRVRQVSEPAMVNGRLRPTKQPWHREVEEQPERFTYFNEDFQSTIHSESLSGLVHDDLSFRNLFIPEPPELSDSESDTDDEETPVRREGSIQNTSTLSPTGMGRAPSAAGTERDSSRLSDRKTAPAQSTNNPSDATGTNTPVPERQSKAKRFGPRPIWWLDVLCPTEAEMKVLSKAFGIHPLTAEDVMMQEQREKVELFRNYYFVTYRSFEQDSNNDEYMEPVSMYVVVFRDGVISFHFSQTPHPANVRRRIRQLKDYLVLTTDWISYAIIDDVTDSYAPLIERIEEEVDEIDEAILRLHAAEQQDEKQQPSRKEKMITGRRFHGLGGTEKQSESGQDETMQAGDMILAVGECRKKVMSLYRLLGNKADVIKGFAKRCNEQWDIAPRSDIGLYLGDIQDHIVTMTGNLSHYENLLSRAHSNYLAQINIRMNERAEKTNDVLGKLTVLGTIVLPMNIVTGLWGMNCLVPGQDVDSLTWFWCLTGGLVLFGCTCYFVAKRSFGIV